MTVPEAFHITRPFIKNTVRTFPYVSHFTSSYITSIGEVSLQDYQQAEEIISSLYIFKQKDFVFGYIYEDIRGRKYIYIGTIILPIGVKYIKQFFDLDSCFFVNRSSLKIVDVHEKVNARDFIRSDIRILKS